MRYTIFFSLCCFHFRFVRINKRKWQKDENNSERLENANKHWNIIIRKPQNPAALLEMECNRMEWNGAVRCGVVWYDVIASFPPDEEVAAMKMHFHIVS